jgi:hypothetical protein
LNPGPRGATHGESDYGCVDGFAVPGARRRQGVDLGPATFREDPVVQRGNVDVDVQCGAAQGRAGREHADAGIADHALVAEFGGPAREFDDRGAGARAVERHFGGQGQAALDRFGAARLLLVRRLGELVRRHQRFEGRDVGGDHRGQP